jgi:parvulin-like peptidyl-prolyl isomerase
MKLTSSTILILILMASLDARAASDATAADAKGTDPATTTGLPADDAVIVKGQGFEIKWRDIDQLLATAKAQNPQAELPADAEVHVVTQLMEIQLVLQKATAEEKSAGNKEADERIAGLLKTLGPTEFDRRLKATHMTADDLRLKFAEDATAQASLTRQLDITATDAEAKKFFDDNPGAYDQPVVARIRELLLLTTSDFSTSDAPPLPAATIQAKRQLIDKLFTRIRGGEDFAALAKQYNEDPVSKDNDDVLAFPKHEMEFGDLAFSMKPNQISNVLVNQDGFRIFQLIEIIPAKKAVFADFDDRIKTMLVGKKKRQLAPAYITQLKKAAEVEVLDPKLKEAMAAAETQAEDAAKAEAALAAKRANETTTTPIAKPQ